MENNVKVISDVAFNFLQQADYCSGSYWDSEFIRLQELIKQQRQAAAEAMKQKCLVFGLDELEKCSKFYVYMKEPDGSDTLSIRLQQAQEAIEAIPTGDC